MLLSVQDINVDAHADLIPQQIGVERQLTGALCSLKRAYLRQARSDFPKQLPGCEIRAASCHFEIGHGFFASGHDFADPTSDRTAGIDGHSQLKAEGHRVDIGGGQAHGEAFVAARRTHQINGGPMTKAGFVDFAARNLQGNGSLTNTHVFTARALGPGFILRRLRREQSQARSQSIQGGHFSDRAAGQNRQTIALIAEVVLGSNLLGVREICPSLGFLLVRNRGGTDLKVAFRALEL